VIGLDGVSAQALSDTIGAIYDCALDPQRWPDTCRKIADLCESTAGGICVHDVRHAQNNQLFVFGYQPEFLEKLGSQYAQSPMAAADIVSDIGHVSALSMEGPELFESRFYREVLRPFGLLDMIWFPALRTGGRMASMHASSVMNGKRSRRTGERHGRISRSQAPPASARRSSQSALARHIEHSPS